MASKHPPRLFEVPEQLRSLNMRNPVVLASGLRGDTPENLKAAYDAGAGAVVTKSVTLKPREGYPKPNFVPSRGGGWLNAIGLRNDGAAEFARRLGSPDFPVIVSLAGSDPDDFTAMIGMFERPIAYELNLSCPHAAGLGTDVGDDSTLTAQIVRAAKKASDVPVFVKIGSNMEGSAAEAIKAGADGLTAINTVPALEVDIDTGKPTLSAGRGGLSGPPILDIALRTVSRMVRAHGVPVMGCGGVSTWEDAAMFLQTGAFAVQVGTAAIHEPEVLGRIAAGLQRWMPKRA